MPPLWLLWHLGGGSVSHQGQAPPARRGWEPTEATGSTGGKADVTQSPAPTGNAAILQFSERGPPVCARGTRERGVAGNGHHSLAGKPLRTAELGPAGLSWIQQG